MDEAKITDFDNGLRILGRMIARVYLRDFKQKANQQTSKVEQKENHANQGSKRGGEVAPGGENQAGDRKRE